MSDEELRAVTIGEQAPFNCPIRLVDYHPNWPGLFRREAARIRDALGSRVQQIEHVGSTSVPRLAAKPIIDIVLAVADSSDEPSYIPDLEGIGYVLRIREPDWHEHRVFKGPETDINLHVFSAQCPEVDRMLLLHDRLRADEHRRSGLHRSACSSSPSDHDAHGRLYECEGRGEATRHWRRVDVNAPSYRSRQCG